MSLFAVEASCSYGEDDRTTSRRAAIRDFQSNGMWIATPTNGLQSSDLEFSGLTYQPLAALASPVPRPTTAQLRHTPSALGLLGGGKATELTESYLHFPNGLPDRQMEGECRTPGSCTPRPYAVPRSAAFDQTRRSNPVDGDPPACGRPPACARTICLPGSHGNICPWDSGGAKFAAVGRPAGFPVLGHGSAYTRQPIGGKCLSRGDSAALHVAPDADWRLKVKPPGISRHRGVTSTRDRSLCEAQHPMK